MRLFAVGLILGLCGTAAAQPLKFQTVKRNGQTFTLPEGFTLEVAAKAPLTLRPVAIAFDNKGRLYVTESSGSNEPAQQQLAKKPHSILRLEDTNGDGVFDKKTVFADQIMFPQGVMWLDGSLYVGTPPQIWKLTDTNDDGVADQREVWFDGQTLTGCLNDLHGPYPGPDGFIYWTKGAFAKQKHTLANGRTLETRASHIFRMKPDRTQFDVVMTGGMDNPVDVAFTPKGDLIFTTTFFQHPANGQRDGLIHAIYGGIYGKDHDVIHDPVHPWTSPNTLPVLAHLGPAAPCGLHRYTSDQFGPDYQDNLFCTQFNLRTVSRHKLVPSGSTYTTITFPFLTSDSIDFHPTDVIEDRDGSLLVVDTGGWYKLCCPTSALVKDDVHGAIYRLRKVGAHQQVKPVAQPTLPELYTMALNRDRNGSTAVQAGLSSADAYTRRLAAHAAGRLGQAELVEAVLAALNRSDNDLPLHHALTYALIELNDAEALLKKLPTALPDQKRAIFHALVALKKPIPSADVIASLNSGYPPLGESALWLLNQQSEHAAALVEQTRQQLASKNNLNPAALGRPLALVVKYPVVQRYLGELLLDPERRSLALVVMQQAKINQIPDAWAGPLAACISLDNPAESEQVLAILQPRLSKPLPRELQERLATLATGPNTPFEVTLKFLGVLNKTSVTLSDATFEKLLHILLHSDNNEKISQARAGLLRARLNEKQLLIVLDSLGRLAPLEASQMIDLFILNTSSDGVGRGLFKLLQQPKLRGLARADQLDALGKKHRGLQAELAELQAAIQEDRRADREKLEKLLGEMKEGDVRRGQVVFYSAKAACSSCHKIGYVGGLVGPDLSRIGSIRSDRDLLEAIVLPSASFVRSYEPTQVTTLDGRVFNGILQVDSPTEVVLATTATEQVRLERKNIESVKPGTVSVMPSGLDQPLSRQDLADLIAFLRSRK